MGSSFVSIDGEHGFWMRDGILELWLRLLALHIPEPTDTDTPATHAAVKSIRDRWLLASKGYFNGCVPTALDEAFSTAEGKAAVIAAIDSLMSALGGAQKAIDKDALNLLGFEGGEFTRDIPSCGLIEVGKAFRDLYAGKIDSTASETSFMPGSG
jgi:hypothetical protein